MSDFPSITELKRHMAQSHVVLGWVGENLIARVLEDAGYCVTITHDLRKGDLRVVTPDGECLYVEVKTARRGKDGTYRFTLVKNGHTDHRACDLCILLCVLKSGDAVPFVVPTGAIEGRKACAIASFPTTYQGALAKYRQSLRKMRINL